MVILEKPIGDTLGWAGLYNDDDDQRLSNIRAMGTFLDYKQTFDRQFYLTQYESYINEVTQNEIIYSSKSSPLIDQLLDWGISKDG